MCENNHPGADDCFRPPDVPTLVECLHCGREYESFRIVWRDNPDAAEDDIPGFWSCPTPGCDGVGFGFDILPVDPEFCDERGEWEWFDDDYAELEEAWDDMEPAFNTLLLTDVDDPGPPRQDGLAGDPTAEWFREPHLYPRSADLAEGREPFDEDDIPF